MPSSRSLNALQTLSLINPHNNPVREISLLLYKRGSLRCTVFCRLKIYSQWQLQPSTSSIQVPSCPPFPPVATSFPSLGYLCDSIQALLLLLSVGSSISWLTSQASPPPLHSSFMPCSGQWDVRRSELCSFLVLLCWWCMSFQRGELEPVGPWWAYQGPCQCHRSEE